MAKTDRQFDPDMGLEAIFGRYPVLDDTAARQLGLRDDGCVATLIERALAA